MARCRWRPSTATEWSSQWRSCAATWPTCSIGPLPPMPITDWSTRIVESEQSDDAAVATLSDSSTVRADLIVGADGPHWGVRRLAFGSEEKFLKPLGGYNAWFTAPDTVGLDGWFLIYQVPGGLNASMRPSHDPGIAEGIVGICSSPLDYDRRDLGGQRRTAGRPVRRRRLAIRCFGRRGTRGRDDFYFDSFAQVHMDRWSTGRVTLVGDAGYCASPLSGMGTSLALVGAYVLAGELGAAEGARIDAKTLRAALNRYQTVMRPYVDCCQTLGNTMERYAPNSAADIAVTAMTMKYMQRLRIRNFAERKWFTTADAVDLPDYSPSSNVRARVGPHIGVAVFEREAQCVARSGFAGPAGQAEHGRLADVEVRIGQAPRIAAARLAQPRHPPAHGPHLGGPARPLPATPSRLPRNLLDDNPIH